MVFIRKPSEMPMQVEERNIPVLTFPRLSQLDMIGHAVTTRLGGVSEGYFRSLNLKTGLGDPDENVQKNFEITAQALHVRPDQFVLSDQTHTVNVRTVTEADAGKGVTRPRDYTDVDGLVTNVPGLVLSIFTADCVPVFLVDPVRRAIGLVHSGWRGTVGRISREAIRKMQANYGTEPADMICAIAPSICQDCYEISEDVADRFKKEFAGHEEEILIDKHNGHYQLDLWQSNRIVLEEAGVKPENIAVTDICTCCNPDLLFSHRASHGRRGVFGSFLYLK